MTRAIEGAGGPRRPTGGGNQQSQQRQAVITQDSQALRSVSFAQIQYLLCEGEIEGPPGGRNTWELERAVRINGTQLRLPNGVMAQQPEDLVLSYGLSWQSQVPGYGVVATPIGVDAVVRNGLPVAQAVVPPDLEAPYRARVILTFQALQRQDTKDGDVSGVSVRVRGTVTNTLGQTYQVFNDSVDGKFSGQFQQEYEFDLGSNGPWSVTVYRDTKDDDEANRDNGGRYITQSTFQFSTVVYLLKQGFRYPCSSMLTMAFRANVYADIPDISIDLKGLKILIPNNYDPNAGVYYGQWDGTFKREYSNNPAWVLYDLIVEDRYGLGEYVDAALVDKWVLYTIAQYCDGQVPNGKGGTERRFTCNLLLQTAADAWEVLQQVSSIFRGMIYWAASVSIAVQDRPADPVFTFSEANTIQEVDDDGTVTKPCFSYAGSSRKARHSVVLTSWDNPDADYQPQVEYLADEEAVRLYGYRPLELRLLGVTSRGQALRAAQWALLSEQLLGDTVTFRVTSIGAVVRPGDVISLLDPNKAGVRYGGRLVSVSASQVVLDAIPPAPEGGWEGAVFSFMHSGDSGQPQLAECAVVDVVEDVVTVDWGSVAHRPAATYPWQLVAPGRGAQPFRITYIEETEPSIYSISALRYREDLYDAVDFDTPLTDSEDYLFKVVDPGVPRIVAAEERYLSGGFVLYVVWQPASTNNVLNGFDLTAATYKLQYMSGTATGDTWEQTTWANNWVSLPDQPDTRELITVADYSVFSRYRVRVKAVTRIGVESQWAELPVLDITATTPLPDLGGFNNGDPPDASLPEVPNATILWTNTGIGSQVFRLQLTTFVPGYVSGWQIEGKTGTRDWVVLGMAPLNSTIEVQFDAAADWEVRASLTTVVPGLSGLTYTTETVPLADIAPPAPRDLRVVVEGSETSRSGERRFSWQAGPQTNPERWAGGTTLDLSSYEIRYRRGSSPDWDNSFKLFSDGIPGDQTWFATKLFDAGQWLIMLRAKDRSGWYSENMAVVTVGIGDSLPSNVVQRESLNETGFPGTRDNFELLPVSAKPMYPLPLSGPFYPEPLSDLFYGDPDGADLVQTDPSLPSTYEALVDCRFSGAQLLLYTTASGTHRWELEPVGRNLGPIYPVPLTGPMYPEPLTDLFYSIPSSADTPGWRPYGPNELVPQGVLRLRLTVISADGITPAWVETGTVLLDYPDRIWTANDILVPEEGTRVVFPLNTFRELKAVSLAIQDDPDQPGEAINAYIIAKEPGYIELRAVDYAGQPAAALVDAICVGY